MPAAGIITEYNPFHYGHLQLLEEARRLLGPDTAIICVMSGNYVQRGDFAVLHKLPRAAAAVQCGADLVFELPLPWAVASAEGFAQGGIAALSALGGVDYLVFGSESGDTGTVLRAAAALRSPAFPDALRRELASGASFPAARQKALAALLSLDEARVLERPNDLLAVEYCKALAGSGTQPLAIPRVGSGHDTGSRDGFSASAIRGLIQQTRINEAMSLMPPPMARAYELEAAAGRAPALLRSCERAILARLRFMDEADFALLDSGGEGLYHRLYRASRSASSLEALLSEAKTKRYPLSRLRRMVLWAYLGLAAQLPGRLPYLRLLAANARGRAFLKHTAPGIPILTKPASVRRLPTDAQRLFHLEARASGLYALACPDPAALPDEWRLGPVICR